MASVQKMGIASRSFKSKRCNIDFQVVSQNNDEGQQMLCKKMFNLVSFTSTGSTQLWLVR